MATNKLFLNNPITIVSAKFYITQRIYLCVKIYNVIEEIKFLDFKYLLDYTLLSLDWACHHCSTVHPHTHTHKHARTHTRCVHCSNCSTVYRVRETFNTIILNNCGSMYVMFSSVIVAGHYTQTD